jgi:ubiquitin carboxyl-terminal hydrolase 8
MANYTNIKMGISKYKNDNGISCYINSILHILQQLPIFSHYIVSEKYLNDLKHKNINVSSTISYELFRIFNLSHNNDNITITPLSFKKSIANINPMWGELQQQDSQEFLIFLISQLEEELGNDIIIISGKSYFESNIINHTKSDIKSITDIDLISDFNSISDIYSLCGLNRNTKNYSIMKELFTGTFSSNIICEFCGSSSPNFENFITLSLEIPLNLSKRFTSLKDCLDHTLKDEIFDSDNKVNCDFCGIKNKSMRRIKIWKSPKILIIHFKRFKVNDYGLQVDKITNQIYYPINNLNLSEYFDEHSPFKDQSQYNLFAINIHQELMTDSIDIGHYTSIVKNKLDNRWYIFNDAHDPELLNPSQIQNKNAYMLFYIREN